MKPLPTLGLLLLALSVFPVPRVRAVDPPPKPVAPAKAKVDFNRDVRPILADNCFACHGPDENARKAKLRLDVRAGLFGETSGGHAVVPGQPGKSEVISRVTSSDDSEKMPPAKSGKKLSPEQIATLKAWVEQGATWSTHWAFEPIRRPTAPTVRDPKARISNPIDSFVLAKLETEGLTPSPEAPRETLIRRMTFDLTGLPPTPEEVEAFVNNRSPDAVEKLADRLLKSPRYGERMAWRWLEAARYADTNGYQTDGERQMWRWRDWVIEAFNANKPFDQFTIEQIAGDMLPSPTLDQRIATGFNRNHRGNSEGGIVPEEYAVEYVVDRVDTTATVWLGLTLGCSRCHDHKFDPFTQREFYQLFAYFNNVPEKGRAVKVGNSPPYLKAPTKDQQRQMAELDAKLNAAERNWITSQVEISVSQEKWEGTLRPAEIPDWSPNRGLVARRTFGPTDTPLVRDGKPSYTEGRIGRSLDFDGKLFADAGDIADVGYDDRFSFALWVKPRNLTGALLSRLPEEPRSEGYAVELVEGKVRVSLTKRWLDDALRVETTNALSTDRWHHVAVTYDGSRLAAGTRVFVDGVEARTNVLFDELNQTFKNTEPFRIGSAGGKATRFNGQLEDVRVYDRVLEPDEVNVLAVADSLSTILQKHRDNRPPTEQAKLRAFYLEVAATKPIREAFTTLRTLREDRRKLWESISTVMVMTELPTPRDTFILKRGEYDKHGAKVSPGVPAALAPLPMGVANNRLGLAKWLTDPANPLTARVAVNRLWQLHFGRGLVKTVEDFGTQGDYPSHPELLDWLASEFIQTGWDVKRMHKLIVTSATYRQSSRMRRGDQPITDPENRLLARGPRQRLSAEMLRDQALFVAGLLVEKQGGPSVKPYQPAGLWNELSGTGDYKPDHGENLYRRSLYTFWKRTVAPPTLAGFDVSGRETCWVRETRTNTPLQALTLLNDPTFVEATRCLAQRVMQEEPTPEKRLTLAFRRLTARTPRDAELKILVAAFERQLAEYKRNPVAAKKLLGVGETKPDPKLDPAELAAYAASCSLIMNLDEAMTKE